MKSIMVDMDNVLTDGVFKKYIEEFYNTKIDLGKVNVYAYVQEYTKERAKEFWEYVSDKSFYDNAPLFDGAYEVLKKLNEKYKVYICTSYLWNEALDLSGNNLKEKYYYLKEKLPFINPSRYIFTTDKSIMNFDIRIDDKLNNLSGATTKLLFSAWHNKNLSESELKGENIIRVNNWKEIGEILLSNEFYVDE